LESRRLNLGLRARLRGIPTRDSEKHRHSGKFYATVCEVIESDILREVRGQKYTGLMAGATHPTIDYDKAMGVAIDAYYSLLETIPYLTGGATKEDMKKMERERAVKDYHENVAFDKRDNSTEPPPVYDHKKVGE
jgi:hypothetical protein